MLTKFCNRKGLPRRIITSDHNTLICQFNIKCPQKSKNIKIRREIFNFNNKENQKKFKFETDNTKDLTDCFEGNESVIEKSNKWLKVLNRKFQKCFKKIRVTKPKAKSEIQKLLSEIIDLKKSILKPQSKTSNEISQTKLEVMEERIADLSADKNAKKIKGQIEHLSNFEGEFSRSGLWEVKKSVCHRSKDPPMAKKDTAGNLVTEPEKLKQLYINEFTNRLRPREMASGMANLRSVKEKLWSKRKEELKQIKTADWNMQQLETVIKSLKLNKARDPLGWINEIFRPEVAGIDLRMSILRLLNLIKKEQIVPKFLKIFLYNSLLT